LPEGESPKCKIPEYVEMGRERSKVVDRDDPCAAVQKTLAKYEGVKVITPEEYEAMKSQRDVAPEIKSVSQPNLTTEETKTETTSKPEACRIFRSEDGKLVLEGPCDEALRGLLEYLGVAKTDSAETSIASKIEELSKQVLEINETIEETINEKLDDGRETVEEVIEEKFEELREELEEGLEEEYEDYEEEEYWE